MWGHDFSQVGNQRKRPGNEGAGMVVAQVLAGEPKERKKDEG
jgi:hypothetical protein